jgi:hypothetical protein
MNINPCFAVLFCCISLPAAATTLDAEGDRFVAELTAVYSKPSAERVRGLLHPKSAACVRADPKYDAYFVRTETSMPLPANPKVSVAVIPADAKLPYAGFEFPVRPSHSVSMEHERKVAADGKSAYTPVAEKRIVKSDGRWYLVFPCPTAEGLARLRDMGLLK